MNNEHAMVTRSSCNDCVHKSVCSYKEDFHDVCNAVAGADVHKYIDNRKVKITNVLTYKDILDEIAIKCKHYRKDTPTQRYQDSITTLTNPCDISTSTSTSTPRSTLETTTDYIFG